jgi:hypothetical protein
MAYSKWNYRVGTSGKYLAIFEVYYDSSGKVCATSANPVSPEADTIEELRQRLNDMLESLEEPIISPVTKPGGHQEERKTSF